MKDERIEENMSREGRLLLYILLAFTGFCAAAFIIYLTSSHGIGISPDSVTYISVARNIVTGEGFTGFDGNALVLQPPLYPLLLASIKLILNIDPINSAGFLNGLFFGLTLFFTGVYLFRVFGSVFLTFAGAAIAGVSYVLMQTSLIALSELPFILLVILFLLAFARYQHRRSSRTLLLFSIITSLACLTRYAGLVLILSGGLSIFFLTEGSMKSKRKDLAIFTFVAALPLVVWLIRNVIVSGSIMGQRGESSYSISANLGFLGITLIKWFMPFQQNEILLLFAGGLLIGLVIIGGVFMTRKRGDEQNPKLLLAGPVLLLICLYVTLIVVSSTFTAYDKISTRLLSPVFIPVIIILFFSFSEIALKMSRYVKPWVVTSLAVLLIYYWGAYHATRSIHIVTQFEQFSGEEYSSNQWAENSVIKYLNTHKTEMTEYSFYSNVPEAVYILSGITTKWSPSKSFYNSTVPVFAKSTLKHFWYESGKVCLVWFYGSERSFLYSIDELQDEAVMIKAASLRDGDIYVIAAR